MGICDIPVIQDVCSSAGQGAASLVTAPFEWLAQAMGGAAAWLFEAVWGVFDATTTVDLTDAGYLHVYDILFGVAAFVMLVFFCLQLITGLTHRDPGALGRAGLGLAKSVLGSFVAVTLIGLLLTITDQLSVGIVEATGNTMSGIGDRLAQLGGAFAVISLTAPGAGAILTIFLAALAIGATFIVWFSLLIRKVLLLVAIVFAPIALAGASWDATRGWVSKWASFVIALTVSKLVLVVIFLVAISQVSAPIDADLASVSQPIAGVALMVIAAFAPYLSYRFLNFAGFDLYHAMSSEQEAKQALNRPLPIPSRPTGASKPVLDGATSSQGGTGGGGTIQPSASAPPATGGTASAAEIGAVGGASTSGATAAGPAGVAVAAGAQLAKTAAGAGPKAGSRVSRSADEHVAAAEPTEAAPRSTSEPSPASAPVRPAPPIPPSDAPQRTDAAPPTPSAKE